jgi:hypothetical protein
VSQEVHPYRLAHVLYERDGITVTGTEIVWDGKRVARIDVMSVDVVSVEQTGTPRSLALVALVTLLVGWSAWGQVGACVAGVLLLLSFGVYARMRHGVRVTLRDGRALMLRHFWRIASARSLQSALERVVRSEPPDA